MRFGIRLPPYGPCGAMLLDGSRSHGTAALVYLGAKGHKGLRRLKSWRAARDAVKHDHEPTASGSAASGSIRDLIGRLATLPEGP